MARLAEIIARGEQLAIQNEGIALERLTKQTQLEEIMRDRESDRRRTAPGYAMAMEQILDPNTPTEKLGGLFSSIDPADISKLMMGRSQNVMTKVGRDDELLSISQQIAALKLSGQFNDQNPMPSPTEPLQKSVFNTALGARASDFGRNHPQGRETEAEYRSKQMVTPEEAANDAANIPGLTPPKTPILRSTWEKMVARATQGKEVGGNTPKPQTDAERRAQILQFKKDLADEVFNHSFANLENDTNELPAELKGMDRKTIIDHINDAAAQANDLVTKQGYDPEVAKDEVKKVLLHTDYNKRFMQKDQPASFKSSQTKTPPAPPNGAGSPTSPPEDKMLAALAAAKLPDTPENRQKILARLAQLRGR